MKEAKEKAKKRKREQKSEWVSVSVSLKKECVACINGHANVFPKNPPMDLFFLDTRPNIRKKLPRISADTFLLTQKYITP